MSKWRVRITLEKKIEAADRATAKAMLYEEVRVPKDGPFACLGQKATTFDVVPTTVGTKPICVDVSASKVKM